jgi:hypothetical protein
MLLPGSYSAVLRIGAFSVAHKINISALDSRAVERHTQFVSNIYSLLSLRQ